MVSHADEFSNSGTIGLFNSFETKWLHVPQGRRRWCRSDISGDTTAVYGCGIAGIFHPGWSRRHGHAQGGGGIQMDSKRLLASPPDE